ncbi:EamA family transporter [Aristophania vespae]|uniref:EamA family transporter n=2 Tax=Aristophania vespae TaxID=2697033 RepID=A0A6P1NIP7_9PROT|nr:EamA family transporter [Aristophania vespae]
MERKTALGFLCGVTAGALWGYVILVPALIRPFTPLQLACVRFMFFGLIASIMVIPRWRKIFIPLGKREWGSLILLSLLGNIMYYLLLGTSVQLIGIATPTLIVGLLPVTVTVVGAFEDGAVPLRKLIPSILLSVAGVVCITWHAYHLTQNSPHHSDAIRMIIGLLCAVAALFCWSAYAIKNARWLCSLTITTPYEWNLLIGLSTGALALCLVPFAFFWQTSLPFSAISPKDWSWFLPIAFSAALVGSILGNACWNKMSQILPLTMVGQMLLFETIFALIYGFLYEQRVPTPLESLAIILVSASVITCMHAHRKPKKFTTEGHG